MCILETKHSLEKDTVFVFSDNRISSTKQKTFKMFKSHIISNSYFLFTYFIKINWHGQNQKLPAPVCSHECGNLIILRGHGTSVLISIFPFQQPRKALLEQLGRILPSDSDTLPDQLIMANTCDRQGAHLAAKLADSGHRIICTAGQADVRATLTCLVAKIQKFCNTKTQNPHLVKVSFFQILLKYLRIIVGFLFWDKQLLFGRLV